MKTLHGETRQLRGASAVLLAALVVLALLSVLHDFTLQKPHYVEATVTTDYRAASIALFQRNTDQLQALSSLFSSPALDDPSWRQRVVATASEIKGVTSQLRALPPPPCVVSVQQALVTASDEMDAAMDLIISGVEPAQRPNLRRAVPMLAAANDAFKPLQSEIRIAQCPAIVE